MYNKFYGFIENPFNMTPNSRFFFASARHTEAISTLIYAIEQRKGFVVITGDIGSGKTTVCRALLNQLSAQTETALITNTHISGRDLLCMVLEDLGIEYQPGSKSRLLSQLNQYLIAQLRMDRNVVLIVDEAQNLTPSVLEEVRMLSNLETEHEKLIQIIFLGQPELKKKLANPRLEQLRQRIAVFYHLTPLNLEEAKEYIRHRLKIASNSDREYFTEGALDLICKFTNGVPRLLNQICDSALLTGFIAGVGLIDEKIADEVIRESPAMQITPRPMTSSQKMDTFEKEKYEKESLNIKIPDKI